ncbi:N-ethylammeline chlorohydrolase [Gammaproteobacteria bacterium SCGC AG-212-F23]|nr:N-ethylammeline chlorohydrolase [Gammaproteobacteria bacterium SCGC AG-212-F23]
MKTVDTLIHARWLITCEEENKILENHSLVVNDKKIMAILPTHEAQKNYTATHTENFPGHAIMPGLINAHTHLAMNYFRGLADDLALMDWLNNHIWPAEKKWVSHEFVYDASLFAMAEMIRSGTTCFNDMYFFPIATAEAVDIAGMRAHIGMTVIDFPTAWATTSEEYFALGMEFFEKYKNHDLVKATLAPHAPYTVCDKNLLTVKDIAEKYDLKINLHLHETRDEIAQSLTQYKMRPIQRLQQLGLMTSRLIAIHMTDINEEDLAIVAASHVSVVNCPESNMKLASGICPVIKFKNHGINIALGTDGAASNNDLNMIGEMRTAAFLAKLSNGNPESLPAKEILKHATLNGAKALGIDHLTGSLSLGKSADIIAIHLDEIETLPVYHPASQIVYAAGRHQVTDVWCRGKRLLKNRELMTLDEAALKVKARDWAKKIFVV